MDRDAFINRPRGVLTKQQREHLLGALDEDPDEDSDKIRMRERRIRQHLRHSLIDFQALTGLRDDELEEVFGDFTDPEQDPLAADEPLRRGIESLFHLLYRALSTFDPEDGLDDQRFSVFLHQGVSQAVQQFYARQGYSVLPSYTIFQVHGTDPAVPLERLKEAYERGEPLYRSEATHLYLGEKISFDEYREYEGLRDREGSDVLVQSHYEKRREWANAATEDVPVEPRYDGVYQTSEGEGEATDE